MAEYIDINKILDRLDRLMHIATEPPIDSDDKTQWVLLRELHKEFSEMPTADVVEIDNTRLLQDIAVQLTINNLVNKNKFLSYSEAYQMARNIVKGGME